MMESLYQRGNTWWIKYYRNGKSYRESSNSDKKMGAKKLLARREGDIHSQTVGRMVRSWAEAINLKGQF